MYMNKDTPRSGKDTRLLCVHVCACVFVRVYVCAHVRVCVRAPACVRLLFLWLTADHCHPFSLSYSLNRSSSYSPTISFSHFLHSRSATLWRVAEHSLQTHVAEHTLQTQVRGV